MFWRLVILQQRHGGINVNSSLEHHCLVPKEFIKITIDRLRRVELLKWCFVSFKRHTGRIEKSQRDLVFRFWLSLSAIKDKFYSLVQWFDWRFFLAWNTHSNCNLIWTVNVWAPVSLVFHELSSTCSYFGQNSENIMKKETMTKK